MGSSINVNEMARFDITVNGLTLSQAENQGLIRFYVEDHVDMIGVAQLTFDVGGTEWGQFDIGGDVEVKVGGSDFKVFVGHITGLQHSISKGRETLTVIAMDPLVKLSASRVTKVYEEQKDSDVVSAVIGDSGASCGKVDSTSEVFKYILQRNESNLNFAKRLASRNGYLLLANEGKVDFVKAQFSGSPVEITEMEVLSLDYTRSDLQIPSKVTVIGWDYITKAKVEGTGSSVNTIGGGTPASNTTWSTPAYISDVWVNSQGAATAMAEGEFNRLARSFIRGRAIVQGNGNLHAGVKVKFTGNKTKFNVEGFVVSSRHIMEPKMGLTTEIVFCGNTAPA